MILDIRTAQLRRLNERLRDTSSARLDAEENARWHVDASLRLEREENELVEQIKRLEEAMYDERS